MSSSFIPEDYQLEYTLNRKIIEGCPSGEALSFDALFVGAGPASLSGAIRLKQLLPDLQIGVIEKAGRLGGHSLSGAVINPVAFQKLFPQMSLSDFPFRRSVAGEKMYFLNRKNALRIPVLWTMKNKGFFIASLCEVVRWLGKKAEELGVNIFPATPAHKLIVENDQVIGVQTTPSGLNRNGEKTSQYQGPVNILAKNIFLADGVRGNLSQTYLRWKNISSYYPQNYALGVKEIWKVSKAPSEVIHTIGYPLKGFGGSFLYPLSDNQIALGLVGGMNARSNHWNLSQDFQIMKAHPFFKKILKDGECLEWGAKAIPEGGFHSIPERLYNKGVFILGDSAGLVNVPSLKGIHYAMMSGFLSAEFLAGKNQGGENDSFEKILKNHPLVGKELYKVRNIKQALEKPLGWVLSGIGLLTGGFFPRDFNPSKLSSDIKKKKIILSKENLSNSHATVSKSDAVYLSGNKTRDDIPSHLEVSKNLPEPVQDFYINFCPAGVYEKKEGRLIVYAPNCVDCKATDILGPWWNPREGGSGPDYSLM